MVVLPVDALALSAPVVWMPQHAKGFIAMAGLSLLLLTGCGRYRARLHISVLDELPTLLGKLFTGCAVVATVIALRHEQTEVMIFLTTAVIAMALVVAGRIFTSQLILLGRRRRIVAHRTVIVGGGAEAAELTILLHRYPRYGLIPVGFVDDCEECAASAVGPQLGGLRDLDQIVSATSSDVVIVADGELSDSHLADVLARLGRAHRDIMMIPRLQHLSAQGGVSDHIGAISIIRLRAPGLNGPAWAVKRAVDIALSASALVVLSPVLAACAIAVRIEGGPGVLFRQQRVGRGGQVFTCLKFRSVRPRPGDDSATRWSIGEDDRIGAVGKWIRRTGLDELPQLWNVLRGEMTIVGPRPERPYFADKFSSQVPRYDHRHRMPAGMTGLAQVSGLRGDVSIADRARFDNYYIENWSLWLDVKVMLRTVVEVFLARGK
jgi:exopolysaccharide biosynthesis polyprenyl glycosylphosphotransferase